MATAADPNRKTNDAPATGSKRRNLLLPALLLSLIAAAMLLVAMMWSAMHLQERQGLAD